MIPELRRYRADDSYLVKSHEPHPGARVAIQLEQRGPSFTAWVGNEPVVCAGVALLWRGVGEGWAYLNPWVENNPLWLCRTVKRVMHEIIKARGLWRFQAYVPVEPDKKWRWPEVLGLHREGRVEKYLPDGSDAYIYAWVKR